MGDLDVGATVRLVNLTKEDYNHHLGQVVSVLPNGRLGVALHGAIWAQDGKYHGGHSERLSFKLENLRVVLRPAPTQLPVLDSIGRRSIARLLGDSGWGLPDNVVAGIASFLQISSVVLSDVKVTGCSSCRGDFPISAVLNSCEDEWWISQSNTCRGGIGSEYLEFTLSVLRRVSFIALKIPPLPYGPLSVREFHLLCTDELAPEEHSWRRCSPQLVTLDRGDMQEFALCPPIECRKLRLMCTKNAAATSAEDEEYRLLRGGNCIGLFQVGFA